MNHDNICALCTSKGKAALSVIRLSGPDPQKIIRAYTPFLPKNLEGHRSYVGFFKDDKREIDQILLTYFSKGRSFTGEETFEISCHGGVRVYSEIIKLLIDKGARLARKGEFSLRAFLNGKIDLLQAEAIQSFVESRSESAQQHAFKQLKGEFSKKLQILEKSWLHVLVQLEADIDFSLEDISELKIDDVRARLKQIKKELETYLSRYRPFENLQKGISLGIFGPTNSGKSSLFNALIQEEKAIVSSVPGTTRDIVEASLEMLQLKDTAGLRLQSQKLEKLGQQKTKETFALVEKSWLVLDCSKKIPDSILELAETFQGKVIWTKQDLRPEIKKEALFKKTKEFSEKFFKLIQLDDIFLVSVHQNTGLEDLKKELKKYQQPSEEFFITNVRHYEKLKKMLKKIIQSLDILDHQKGERDLMAHELREGLHELYELTGRRFNDEILDSIFKTFCIGK